MKKDKELVYKPNQTIMITNKNITATQRKAYNIILHKAWNDLKVNENQTKFKLSIANVKSRAGLKATDNVKLKNGLQKLTTTGVEIVKDNGNWDIFTLLSRVTKDNDDELIIELPTPIRQALIDNSYYTTLDLLTIKSLESKYAIILYEMAIRYHKVKVPEITIDELKELTGTTEIKGYNKFTNFNNRVLAPATKEINEKTDITLSYEPITKGRKVISVKFKSTLKPDELSEQQLAVEEIAATSETDKTKEIIELFRSLYKAELNPKRLKVLIDSKGSDYVETCVHTYKKYTTNRTIKNIAGDFYTYVMEGYTEPKGVNAICNQIVNYEQRKYEDDEFDQYIANQ